MTSSNVKGGFQEEEIFAVNYEKTDRNPPHGPGSRVYFRKRERRAKAASWKELEVCEPCRWEDVQEVGIRPPRRRG